MKIEDIDKNLKVKKEIDRNDVKYFDVKTDGFSLFGLPATDEKLFRRMPESVAKKVNPGVERLYSNTSGGRVIFETDSPFVAIRAFMPSVCRFSHMPLTGTTGFDVFTDEGEGFFYTGTFCPPVDMEDGFESIVDFYGEKKQRKIMIHFPLYNDVSNLFIGIQEGTYYKPYNPYKDVPPIYYYGSSITQGGCASRPGNNYPAVISRKNNIDFVCLGFSGNAFGEPEMAEYIANREMSVFVMDLDHNFSDVKMIRERHYPFYKIIREKNPDLPIIMVTAPAPACSYWRFKERYEVIHENYKRARAEGDDNLYFINGMRMMDGEYCDMITVDGCHPNDFGFYCMARGVLEVLNKII